jgi:septum formation protein
VKKVVLASASPRRAAMLKNVLANLSIVPSKVDETKIKAKTPGAFAVAAATAKAKDVGTRRQNAVVIGADTIVVLGKKIIGKPKNGKDAVRILKALSGKTHKVITGLAVLDTETGVLLSHQETTKVKMRKLPMNEITKYVATGSPLDKAGAYGIQEIEEMFIEKIEGDYDNVVGLPIAALLKLLRKLPPA